MSLLSWILRLRLRMTDGGGRNIVALILANADNAANRSEKRGFGILAYIEVREFQILFLND